MKLVVAFAAVALLMGCQKKEESKANPPSSKFSDDELDPGKTEDLGSDNLQYYMADTTQFQAGGDASFALADDEGTCIQDKIDALTASADEGNITVDAVVDVKDCLANAFDSMTIEKADLSLLVWYGCDKGKLKDNDGKSVAELSTLDLSFCQDSKEIKQLFNVKLAATATGDISTSDDQTVKGEVDFNVYIAKQATGGAPCTASFSDNNWNWGNDCRSVERSFLGRLNVNGVDQDLTGTESYTAAAFNNIVEANDSTAMWYQSGNFDVILNNWKGDVTYSDKDTAPSWSLSNGVVTITGTLDSGSALHLAPKVKRILARIKK